MAPQIEIRAGRIDSPFASGLYHETFGMMPGLYPESYQLASNPQFYIWPYVLQAWLEEKNLGHVLFVPMTGEAQRRK